MLSGGSFVHSFDKPYPTLSKASYKKVLRHSARYFAVRCNFCIGHKPRNANIFLSGK
jgi:hypothetical protein